MQFVNNRRKSFRLCDLVIKREGTLFELINQLIHLCDDTEPVTMASALSNVYNVKVFEKIGNV